MAKMNKLRKKRLPSHAQGWYVLIDIFQTYTNISSSWLQSGFLSGFLMIHFVMESFSFYTPFPFHLSLPHVDQITNLLDIVPINTFLKSLWVAVKLEVTVQVSLPH